MYRRHSSRNQRNRGIKVKHALQICLLVAICFWLIYQVKRSHDKNEEFEESDEKGSLDRGSIGGLIRIRRKNVGPLYEEIVTDKKQQHNQAMKEENEASRDGDDEHEVERLDTEVDQEEDNRTDEAREDGIHSETEGEVSDHDNDDESNHEAREEFYEADGASSAVTHDNHSRTSENEKQVVGISDQHHGNILEQEDRENHSEEASNGEIRKRLEIDGGEISDYANLSSKIVTNITTKENNSGSSEKGSSLTEGPTDDNLEASNSTTDVTAENPKLSDQNVTESVPKLDHDQGIVTEGTSTEVSNLNAIGLQQANTSTLAVSDSESTGHTEPKNSKSNLHDFSRPSNDTFVRMTRSKHSLKDETNTQNNETVSDISDSGYKGDAKDLLYTLPEVKELMVNEHIL